MLLVSLWGELSTPWASSIWASTSSCSWWLASMSTWAWSPSGIDDNLVAWEEKNDKDRKIECKREEQEKKNRKTSIHIEK